MSQTYIAVLITLIAPWLPKLGIVIGNDALTTTLVTLVTIVSALWALYRRYRGGGVTSLGLRK